MKNQPIFTVRDPELSRWQSFVEQVLKEKNPDLSIAEIRNMPIMQGCWQHVQQAMNGQSPKKPTGEFDSSNTEHNAYASAFFLEAIQQWRQSKDFVSFSSSVNTWPYSTADIWEWLSTSAGQYYLKGWWNFFIHGDFYKDVTYRDYKEEGNGNINYSVIDWKLPENAKIALIGDWGTANDDAHLFLKTLVDQGVDCIIHLGDVYYTGTKDECIDNFLNVIRDTIGTQVPVFTIPGNHEYYSFGKGFFYLIDHVNSGIPVQNARQDASYFCLRTENSTYQFLGIDTGFEDHSPVGTALDSPAPGLKSSNDYKWALDKIHNFGGKTILLSHHQLFSRTAKMKSDEYGDSFANPYLYRHFAPYFHNKIAAWYWGHEHSFALFKNGAFGLNQGRLVGSSSYEEAVSDQPYESNYPMVPYSNANEFLGTNPAYYDDNDANYYYPHVGAIITMRESNNPMIDYYSYPSWENGHAPSNPQLTHIANEIIQNPTKSPTGAWVGNHKIKDSKVQSNKAPALSVVNGKLYMVYRNNGDHDKLWWDCPYFDVNSEKINSNNPVQLPVDITNTGNDSTPTTDKHPAMVYFNNKLYLVYKDSDNTELKWCTYNIAANEWTKEGAIQNSEVNSNAVESSNGVSLTVFNNIIYCFYLNKDDNSTVEYATCDGTHWTYAGSIGGLKSYHTVCPAVVGNSSNLFMIYAPSNDSHSLGMMRKDLNGNWHNMGYVTNGDYRENVPKTSYTVMACGDDKFIRLLYKCYDNNNYLAWATLDLGYYNDLDQFVSYDLNTETPTWSGGLPIVCTQNGSMPQSSAMAGYCMGQEYSFMIYPGNSGDTLWSGIQKNW